MTLSELHQQLNQIYARENAFAFVMGEPRSEAIAKQEKRNQVRREADTLFEQNYAAALRAEGLNERTAALVSAAAYERGHSSGCSEIVNLSIDLVDFTKKVIEANGMPQFESVRLAQIWAGEQFTVRHLKAKGLV